MSTTRSLRTGRFPIGEITGTWPASTIGLIRPCQPSTPKPASAARRRMSVRPLLRLPLGHRHGLPVELRLPVDPAHERVLHEVLVVAIGIVVRPCVGAAALLAGEPADDHAVRELEQELE